MKVWSETPSGAAAVQGRKFLFSKFLFVVLHQLIEVLNTVKFMQISEQKGYIPEKDLRDM
jgi:hypothetical protein